MHDKRIGINNYLLIFKLIRFHRIMINELVSLPKLVHEEKFCLHAFWHHYSSHSLSDRLRLVELPHYHYHYFEVPLKRSAPIC